MLKEPASRRPGLKGGAQVAFPKINFENDALMRCEEFAIELRKKKKMSILKDKRLKIKPQ